MSAPTPALLGRNLPQFVRDLVSNPPRRGEGKTDDWLFRTARGLCPYRDDAEIVALLDACIPGEAAKVRHVVGNARNFAWEPEPLARPHGGGRETKPIPVPYPEPDLARIGALVKEGARAVELWMRSPVLLDEDDGSRAAEIITVLLAGPDEPDPLVCAGEDATVFDTIPLSEWVASGRLPSLAFIVPARMTAEAGLTRTGKVSRHCLANTGQRRHVVVEFDFKEFDKENRPTQWAPLILAWREGGKTVQDACAALGWHLAGYAPLALAVHSGGKSLHFWFPVGDATSADIQKFMGYAASIGADPALFRNRSQFTRMPSGTRDGGCRQSVFFLNPSALATVPAVNREEAR